MIFAAILIAFATWHAFRVRFVLEHNETTDIESSYSPAVAISASPIQTKIDQNLCIYVVDVLSGGKCEYLMDFSLLLCVSNTSKEETILEYSKLAHRVADMAVLEIDSGTIRHGLSTFPPSTEPDDFTIHMPAGSRILLVFDLPSSTSFISPNKETLIEFMDTKLDRRLSSKFRVAIDIDGNYTFRRVSEQ
jgi:hypothetical protein